jgi:general secretion pathway protein K
MDLLPASMGRHRETGVALITVLLIVFLASVAAASLASVQQLAIRRSTLLLQQEQARLYTLGVEEWAAAILRRNLENGDNVDSLDQDWANLPPSLPVQGGSVSGRIQDLQGLFNLNSLLKSNFQPLGKDQNADKPANQENADKQEENGDPRLDKGRSGGANLRQDSPAGNRGNAAESVIDQGQFALLQRLLQSLEIKNAEEIAQAIADWIDPDPDPRFPGGAEDSEYSVRTPSYLAANRPFTSVSELRLIKGIDQEAYAKLSPYVCALPVITPINVNTTSALFLTALSAGSIDSVKAEALIEELKTQGFKSVNDFLMATGIQVTGTQTDSPVDNMLAVNSHYFLVSAEAQLGDAHAVLRSVLERGDDGTIRILTRSFGNEN